MEFPYLKKYAAFILDQYLEEFVRLNIERVKEVKLPLLKLFAGYSEEQLYAYSYNNIQPFIQSLAEGTALESMQQNAERWKANQVPNVPRNSVDVKDLAFSPHTRKYAFIKLLKYYTTDLAVYETVLQQLDAFYAHQQAIALETFVDIENSALRDERDFIATILDNTADGISAYDTNGTITLWNKALETRSGVPKSKVVGQNMFAFFNNYEDKENVEAMERVFRGEKVSLKNMPLKDRPGFYEVDLTPLINSQGTIVGAVSFSRDITEQKQAQDKLKKSEALMAQAQSIAHFGSWEWDATSGKITWSDELYRIFGYEPQSAEIDPVWLQEHIHSDSPVHTEEIINKAARQNGNFEITTRITRKDDSNRVMLTKGLVLYDSEGKPAKIFGASQDVTEEKEMQQLVQGVLNGSLSGLIYLKAIHSSDKTITDFEYVLVNEAAYQYLQRTQNLVGLTMLDVYPGIKQTKLFNNLQQVVELGITYTDEIYYNYEKLQTWFKIHAVKHDYGMVLSFEDISATKEAKRKIQEEKEFSDSLIANSIDGIVSLDAGLHYTAWNPVMEHITGKQASQVLGRHVLEVFPATENSKGVQAMYAALQGKPTNLPDSKYMSREGYYDSYVFPMYNNERTITGVMSIIHDVSERKLNEIRQAEAREEISRKNQELAAALQELEHYKDHLVHLNNRLEEKVKERTAELMKSEKQIRLVADALPVLVAYIDVKEKYQFNNKAYSEWFGQPIEAIQGLSIRQLVGEERYQVAAPYIRRALQGERIQYDTTIMHIEKGKRYVSASYVPHIEEGKSLGFYSILVDITERVINEQALQTAFVEMEHKNQELSKINELLDNFVYMAAHDLKSPVANLKLLTGMLIRTDNSIHPELYAAIVESVNRLDNTINGLVEVIEIQSVQDIPVKTLDLKEQFAMLLHEHAEEIRGSGSVVDSDFSAHPSLKYVEAYLQSILKNLLTNAIKYRKNDIPLHLEVRSENAGGYVVVSFRDNGIGMNLKKYKQHLFKPFTRFTNRASGKGLGLHLIKSMVEKNGGKVQVESEPDKGTTFYVYLKEY